MERSRIALVDDNLDLIGFLVDTLSAMGHEVIPLRSLEDVAKIVPAPDVVLADLARPIDLGVVLQSIKAHALREEERLTGVEAFMG